jgi:tetratricopeptide (TPR) repeat protein
MQNFKLFMFALAIAMSSTIGYATNVNSDRQKPDDENDEGITVGMARAWVLYNNKDFYGALRIYKALYAKAPGHAKLNYRMGICYEALNVSDSAITHIEKALTLDVNVGEKAHYFLGSAYQFNGNLDKAIEHYYEYKKVDDKERTDVNRLLRQCETARQMMQNPVDAKISNMGNQINTEFVDASPSITADQTMLIFTSRRPENAGGKICEFNEQYFDDIYYTNFDENAKTWSKATSIGSPINTESFDANLSITPDGQNILLYKNVEGLTKSGDIYISSFNNEGKWSNPQPIDDKYINSSYFESSASMTADGKTLYFVSERERGGLGFGDIWVSHKQAGVWQKPFNIGPVINTEFDEIGVYIHPDGKTLFFSSEGHNSMGMHDIFISTLNSDNTWSTPINLGYPINSTKDEIHFVLSASKDMAYISSNREGGLGSVDIYEIDMSKYFQSNKSIPKELADQFTTSKLSILKGTVVDGESGKPIAAQLTIHNSKTGEVVNVETKENGSYFITLDEGVRYEVSVISATYKTFTFKIKGELSTTGGTNTTTKHILMNKQ